MFYIGLIIGLLVGGAAGSWGLAIYWAASAKVDIRRWGEADRHTTTNIKKRRR